LHSGEFDLKEIPELLPALAAVACFARGDTALVNVSSTRITVIAEELGKLGVKTTQRPDGLVVHGTGNVSQPQVRLDGRGDPSVVMALACAALACSRPVEISGAESVRASNLRFLELLTGA